MTLNISCSNLNANSKAIYKHTPLVNCCLGLSDLSIAYDLYLIIKKRELPFSNPWAKNTTFVRIQLVRLLLLAV